MSNTPVSASTTPSVNGPAASARPGKQASGDGAAPGGLFASMLSLLGATPNATTDASAMETASLPADAPDTTGSLPEQTDNPLLAMLGWLQHAATPVTTAGSPDVDGAQGAAAHALPDAALTPAASDPLLQSLKPVSAQAADALTAVLASTVEKAGTGEAGPSPDGAENLATPFSASATAQSAARRSLTAKAALATGRPSSVKNGRAAGTATAALQTAAQQTDTNGLSKSGTATQPGRSTVALNERYGANKALEAATTPTPVTLSTTSAGLESTLARPTAGGLSGIDLAASPGGSGNDIHETQPAEHSGTRDPASETPYPTDGADADTQLSTWGTQHLRHASLRVGEAGQDVIDVKLSLAGQEVQVDFRTDSAEARASLQHSANQSLGDLLQRSGIQLAGVSVGSQGQPQDRAPQQDQGHRTRAGGDSHPSQVDSATRSPAAPKLRADGSRPLDLFV